MGRKNAPRPDELAGQVNKSSKYFTMNKDASTKYVINPLLKKRWSPRAFLNTPVPLEKLQSMFEAARWSPSGGNQQPWRFIVGFEGDETYKKLFETLAPGNQEWVFHAPVLIATVGRSVLNTDETISNSSYRYDVGQSVAHFTFQACQEGLFVHQMAGFDNKEVEVAFDVPFPYEVLTLFVVGYLGEPELLKNKVLIEHEKEPRTRKNFNEIIFSGRFGIPLNIFED